MEDIFGETGSVNAELKTYNEKITTLCTKWNDAKTKQRKKECFTRKILDLLYRP